MDDYRLIEWGVNMYIYQLTHNHDGDIKLIGYFSSWKKARIIMKKYRSSVEGFKVVLCQDLVQVKMRFSSS